MKLSPSWARMERRAPASRVERERARRWGGVEGWGVRALRARRLCLADLRREAVCGEEGEADWRAVRVCRREDSVVMAAGGVVEVGEGEGEVLSRDVGGRAAGGGTSSDSGVGMLSQMLWVDKDLLSVLWDGVGRVAALSSSCSLF